MINRLDQIIKYRIESNANNNMLFQISLNTYDKIWSTILTPIIQPIRSIIYNEINFVVV